MFTGVKAAAQGTAKRQALKELDESLYPHMLFYKGELKTYKEALDFEHKDVPYFFVLDKDGKIIYATSGAFSDKKLGEIEELIDDF
jgi:flagellar basal body rod protein FlgG